MDSVVKVCRVRYSANARATIVDCIYPLVDVIVTFELDYGYLLWKLAPCRNGHLRNVCAWVSDSCNLKGETCVLAPRYSSDIFE